MPSGMREMVSTISLIRLAFFTGSPPASSSKQACFEADKIFFLCQEFFGFGSTVIPDIGVGVFIGRKHDDSHIHSLLQYQVYPPERSHDAGLVAIIKDGDVLCKSFYKPI